MGSNRDVVLKSKLNEGTIQANEEKLTICFNLVGLVKLAV
jgi:hypothetical protein